MQFTGGDYGVYCRDYAVCMFSQLVVTNNPGSGAWNHGYGVCVAAGNSGYGRRKVVLANALLAGNAGGFSDGDGGSGSGMDAYLVNDTITANLGNGVSGGYADIHVLNSVVAGNASVDLGLGYANGIFSDSCLYGKATRQQIISVSGSNGDWYRNSQVRYRHGVLRLDPLIGSDYRLTAGSKCLKRGTVASAAQSPWQADVFGNDWNGEYDMGCFKSSLPVVDTTRYGDVYVSESGDDTKTGASVGDAVRSLPLGLFRTAAGGTCHVGPGNFTAPAIVDKDGVSLLGAGSSATFVDGVPSFGDVGVAVSAHNVTVSGLTSRSSIDGVYVAPGAFATNVVVAGCELVGNQRSGIRRQADGYWCNENHQLHITHSILSNNFYGISFSGSRIVADNCLIVKNGLSGKPMSGGVVCIYTDQIAPYILCHCTIADNVCGIYSGRSYGTSLTHVRDAYNCIISGNQCGYSATDTGTYGRFYRCLMYNVVDNDKPIELLDDMIYADPRFQTGSRAYRLASDSPAKALGKSLAEIQGVPASAWTDLDGRQRRASSCLGCYLPFPGSAVIVK